jgi:hypothetical protein
MGDASGFRDCVDHGDGTSGRLDYINTYPAPMPGLKVDRTYPDNMCTTDNMNYFYYTQVPLELTGIPFGECMEMAPDVYVMYSSDSCASTGQVLIQQYSDASCTTLVETQALGGNNCVSDDDGADDDDDDGADDDDDDDADFVGAITDVFCT